MGDVLKFKRPTARERGNGRTLCGSGFHKWKTQNEKRFDVKLGKLLTVDRCERCGKVRTRLT